MNASLVKCKRPMRCSSQRQTLSRLALINGKSTQVPCAEIMDDVKALRVPKCAKCVKDLASLSARPVPKRKRSSRENSKARKRWDEDDSDSDGQYDIPQPGVMKPDITFFGEPLPNRFFDLIKEVDSKKVDLVIVIGTSFEHFDLIWRLNTLTVEACAK